MNMKLIPVSVLLSLAVLVAAPACAVVENGETSHPVVERKPAQVKLRLNVPGLGIQETGTGTVPDYGTFGGNLALELPRIHYLYFEFGIKMAIFSGGIYFGQVGFLPAIIDGRDSSSQGWLLQGGGSLGYRTCDFKCTACDGYGYELNSHTIFTGGAIEATYFFARYFGINMRIFLLSGLMVASSGDDTGDPGDEAADAAPTWVGSVGLELGFTF
jgi:hypothetical protein